MNPSQERRNIMKTNISRILTIAAIALVTICASATPASAQAAFRGNFTLPNDVRWAGAVLPAGDYKFDLKSVGLPARITLWGPNGGAFVTTSATDQKNDGDMSVITIQRRGGMRFVSDIYLADLGLHLHYKAPSIPKSEQELAQGPASTEQVLIAMAKK
jgi:hypothetical protein